MNYATGLVDGDHPHIENRNGNQILVVEGKPFTVLAGEVHNSSGSSLAYMERIWPVAESLSCNTLFVPVYWENIEPKENEFDFTLVNGIIDQARAQGMKLVLLWFGLWKNAESNYVPLWVKGNRERYFLSRKHDGQPLNCISPFCEEAVASDAKAFARLMRNIRRYDADHSTVIMMQVENEVGILGSDRDYCSHAETIFRKGETPERFMAKQFAKALETITAAGKKEYPIPMYANAWLKQHPWYPGSYPSGGPTVDVHDIWRKEAPSLDALAPDIYLPEAATVMDEYHYYGNPLIIPEARQDASTAGQCLYAFAQHGAIAYSVFGIEDMAGERISDDRPSGKLLTDLNIESSAFDPSGAEQPLKEAYRFISAADTWLLKCREQGNVRGFCQRGAQDIGTMVDFDDYRIVVTYAPTEHGKTNGAGLVVRDDSGGCYIIAFRCDVEFRTVSDAEGKALILDAKEIGFQQHGWQTLRVLNGDERGRMYFGDRLRCMYLRIGTY